MSLNLNKIKIRKSNSFLNLAKNAKIQDAFNGLAKKKMNTGLIFCKKQLVGLITSGDFRKAIYNNTDFSLPIHKIMNKKFISVDIEKTKDKDFIKRIFLKFNNLIDLPVLNKKKFKFLYKRSIVDNKLNNLKEISLVVMAGGMGKRLRPFTYIIPKPLMPLKNKTLIQEIIDRLVKYKIKNTFIISNYKKKFLNDFLKIRYKNIHFYEEKKFLGTFGGIKFIEKKLTENFFLTNCDTIIDFNYLELLKHHKKHEFDITVVISLKGERSKYGLCTFDKKYNLLKLCEKPINYHHVNTGFYLIKKKVLRSLKKNVKTDITDFINKNQKKMKIGVFHIHGEQFQDFGQLESYIGI